MASVELGFLLVQSGSYENLPVIIEMGKATKEKFLPNPKLKLREQLREVMRFGHFSHRTESAYWHWIKGFILFHKKRHPPMQLMLRCGWTNSGSPM